MARKKIEPIESLGRDADKLVVQKSKPLFALWQSELTLAEFKILDTYLSRIDSKRPDRRAVVFTKGELENILGVKKINIVDLKQRLKNLSSPIDIGDRKKKIHLVGLFEECYAEQDDNGLWQVRLECTQKAMKYIFNIENLGYLRYKLRCITSLKSRQAYVLFMYLESNRFRTPFEVELEELKQILGCEKEETYREYKRFNDRVLKRIQKELLEKTECRYSYEPVKQGRSVVAIRFILETLPKTSIEEVDPNQITLDDILDSRELWEKELDVFGFTVEQMEEIRQIMSVIPHEILPETPACYGNIDLMRYHYIKLKVADIQRRNAEKPIKNKYAYLVKIMKNDAGTGK